MSTAFPYILEYEYNDHGPRHNSCSELSEEGARGLYNLLIENRRVVYARYWKFGEEGNRAEYWGKR